MSAVSRIAAVVLWTIVLLAVIFYGAPLVQQYAQANQAAITALSALVVAIFTVALTWFAYHDVSPKILSAARTPI